MESTSKDVMSREEVRLRIFDEVLKYRPAAAAAVQDTLHLMDADAKCGDTRLSNAKADFDSKNLDMKGRGRYGYGAMTVRSERFIATNNERRALCKSGEFLHKS